MNKVELRDARRRRNIAGKDAGAALGLTADGYYKKEHGDAVVSLSDAFTLTRLYNLNLKEFVDIFFDGDLPFLSDERKNYDFSKEAMPIRAARLRAKMLPEEVASILNVSLNTYRRMERGGIALSLERCIVLSKAFRLTLSEFNDVFFRSTLPFRKNDLLAYNSIISQERSEINA